MNRYSKCIEFSLKENADNYIQAGWELLKTHTSLIGADQAMLVYWLAWPLSAGEPIEPPIIDDLQNSPLSSPSLN